MANKQTRDSCCPPRLAIILPCYNEGSVLPSSKKTVAVLLEKLIREGGIAEDSFVLFVDDGSQDNTWELIQAFHEENPTLLKGLKLGGNAGHQNALYAGMMAVRNRVDCAVSVDADLQDDISVLPQMLEAYRQGKHIVYGVRKKRRLDTWFKRNTAHLFYLGMRLMGVHIIPGHADFRLVDSLALNALAEYTETNLFLRTLFPSMNLKYGIVYYDRKARTAGESKYPLHRMISFALMGITTSSATPLRLAALLGVFTFFLALIQSIITILAYLEGAVIPGWTSMILVILYLGAVQLLCLAILGEYTAKIFRETKHRPKFVIEKQLK